MLSKKQKTLPTLLQYKTLNFIHDEMLTTRYHLTELGEQEFLFWAGVWDTFPKAAAGATLPEVHWQAANKVHMTWIHLFLSGRHVCLHAYTHTQSVLLFICFLPLTFWPRSILSWETSISTTVLGKKFLSTSREIWQVHLISSTQSHSPITPSGASVLAGWTPRLLQAESSPWMEVPSCGIPGSSRWGEWCCFLNQELGDCRGGWVCNSLKKWSVFHLIQWKWLLSRHEQDGTLMALS